MVRKIVKTMALCLALVVLLIASPTQARADDGIYTEGNISSTFTTFFKDILQNAKITDDYVYFRNGEYSYCLVVGDLNFNNGVFSGSEIERYTITTNSSGYYQSNYRISHTTDTNFRLNAQDYLVYSNLGYYPTLIERGFVYDYATLFVLVVGCLCFLIRSIFGFTYRFRNG